MSAHHSERDWLPRVEHVWVEKMSITYEKVPGLLLAWRHHPAHPLEWQGWVIFVRLGSARTVTVPTSASRGSRRAGSSVGIEGDLRARRSQRAGSR